MIHCFVTCYSVIGQVMQLKLAHNCKLYLLWANFLRWQLELLCGIVSIESAVYNNIAQWTKVLVLLTADPEFKPARGFL